jgi:hypothetical protein
MRICGRESTPANFGDVGLPTGHPVIQLEWAWRAFAILLLIAAALKAHASVTEAPPSVPQRWMAVLVPTFESVLAVWLLSGAARAWATRVAVATLIIFICIAGWALISGKDDCGCFGGVRVHPGWTLALDLVVLTALIAAAGPHDGSLRTGKGLIRIPSLRPLLPVLVSLALVSVIAAAVREWTGRPLSALFTPTLASVEPTRFSRAAREGETVVANFTVRNVSESPIRLVGAASSCGCTVIMTDFPVELPPGAVSVIPIRMTVGRPDGNGRFSKFATLLTNRRGTVPPLVVEANVIGSATSR